MKRCKILFGLCLMAWSAVQAANVEQVDVTVATAGAMPTAVRERMAASIRVIGERVLVGQDTETLRQHERDYESVIADVAGRVVGGYAVTGVELIPAPNAAIRVTVTPYGETVQSVQTEIDYGNLSTEAAALIATDLDDVDELTNELLVGLPIDSLDWVGSISDTLLAERLAQRLPEFIVRTDIDTAAATKVKLFLIPRGTITREWEINIRESTVPKIFLNGAVRRIEERIPVYMGLPADFIARHREAIAADLIQAAAADSFTREYDIDLAGELQTGRRLTFDLVAKTDTWVIQGNLYIDMGHRDDGTVLRGYLGRKIGKRDTLFADAEFYPNSVNWDIYLGYAHEFHRRSVAGYRYELTDHDHRIFLRQGFGNNWYLRWEHGFRNSHDEFGFGYRFHEYVGVEYVVNDDDNWVRLIGYL